MAGTTHTAAGAYSGTITANNADHITMTGGTTSLVILNTATSGALWVRIDYAQAAVDAVANADGSYEVPGGNTLTYNRPLPSPLTISLLAASAVTYEIEVA